MIYYTGDIHGQKYEIVRFCIHGNHGGFYDGLKKAIKKCSAKEEFAKAVKKEAMYYYWSKCEWEILISP